MILLLCIQALEKCKEHNHELKHCIVVRHLPRLSQAKKDKIGSPAKRNNYDYKVSLRSANIHTFAYCFFLVPVLWKQV